MLHYKFFENALIRASSLRLYSKRRWQREERFFMKSQGILLQDDKIQHTVIRQMKTYHSYHLSINKSGRYYRFAKRLMDIVSSLVAIVILIVPMLIISLLIFLQDFHSPIFKQIRVTKDGRFFTMYKFRTMHVDAEQRLAELQNQNEANGPVFKMENDPRVTKLGRVLRRTSIDEIPQFFNVLNGTMSLVGPRPPLPREVEKYTPYQMHRLDVKGGITCYWQCSGRSNIMFNNWIELDLKYIRESSIWVDTKILFRTFGAVLRKDGAE